MRKTARIETMTRRQRVIAAVNFQGPDRIPFVHNFNRAPEYKYGQALIDLYRKYPDDFGWFPDDTEPEHHECGETFQDAWGIEWEYPGIPGYALVACGHPLADDKAIKDYEPPVFDKEGYRAYQQKQLDHMAPDAYRLLLSGSIQHHMVHLRGFENVMMDTAYENEAFFFVRDLAMNWLRNEVQTCAALDCDEIMVGDDWGSQSSPFISPAKWRKLYLPLYKEIGDIIHSKGKKYHLHSDGMVLPLMDDFLEAGVDVLNIEHTIIGIERVSERYRGKVCFRSNTDRQHILTRPDREAIYHDIEQQIKHLSTPDGGMVFYFEPAPEVSLEVHRIVLESFDELRDYWNR